VLRSFQRASYAIDTEGHFALASADYCHFTSPIRRYPDLMVHRAVAALVQGRLKPGGEDVDADALQRDADFLSTRERIAQAAEIELRLILVLLHLSQKKGELFGGIITGVTDFGIFVQTPKFLIEGLIRLPDLGDDWWEVVAAEGKVRGDLSGKVFRIGDSLEVRIDGVDMPRRQLLLSPSYMPARLDRGQPPRRRSVPPAKKLPKKKSK
jgi:ribonuclease R